MCTHSQICILLMGFYIRRHPKKATKLFKSMLRTEVKIVMKLLFEVFTRLSSRRFLFMAGFVVSNAACQVWDFFTE